MCQGHPSTHPCSHTSITWHYCPSAAPDLDSGYEAPCADISFAPARAAAAGCPLQNCQFTDMGGSWTCCACGRGPNARGWCMMPTARLRRDPKTFEVEAVEATCDHGCCNNCTHFGTSRSPTPDHPLADLQHSPRQYTHGRSSRHSGFAADDTQALPFAASSLSSSASSSLGYKIDLDYSSVGKKKGSAKKARKGKH